MALRAVKYHVKLWLRSHPVGRKPSGPAPDCFDCIKRQTNRDDRDDELDPRGRWRILRPAFRLQKPALVHASSVKRTLPINGRLRLRCA